MIQKNHTILVVEDERPLLEAIKIKLEKSGLVVATARSVPQALEYLKELPKVDAIWLDHYLFGKESGLDFIANVKADGSKWKSIPVFVVSNTASEEKVQSYMRFGATKYYTKSEYRLDQIISEIESFLNDEKE